MMGAKIGFILLMICIILSITISAQDNDFASLQALKVAWQNTPPTWDDGSDPCGGSWVGITCTNARVTRITLASMQLKGNLQGDIWQLTELEILDLSYNIELSGSLPTQVQNLRKLTHLSLIGCSFTGPIPDTIGNLQSLVSLSLNSNNFTGSIPASIGNLRILYWLDLTENRLTGSLPVSNGRTPGLDMLTNAKHFHLGDNQLSGAIPPQLFNSNMTLIHLQLQNNRLTGTIPSTLGLVTSLEVVRLDRNLLSGNIPSNVNNLTNTSRIFMSHNKFIGPIPNLTGMNALNYIDLSNNTFDRSATPSWFSTIWALTTINMNNTNLEGQLPTALFSIPKLQKVDLSHNWISGSLDIGSDPSTQLQLVDLRNNQITEFVQQTQYGDKIDVILEGNTICGESGRAERFCSAQTNTTSYQTPFNNCEPLSCDTDLVVSPNCHCACPYKGSFSFKFATFSTLGNSIIYISLHDSLMDFFKKAGLPVDSVSLKNPRRSADDYFVIDVEFFPAREPSFNSTGIHGLAFGLITNQTFIPPKEYNMIYSFTPENNYNLFPAEISGNRDTKHKSSNIEIVVGSTLGGCVIMVLLVLAGIYSFRQKEGTERAPQQSQPFALWDSTSGSGGVPQLKGARAFTLNELQKYTNNFSEINNIGRGGYGHYKKIAI